MWLGLHHVVQHVDLGPQGNTPPPHQYNSSSMLCWMFSIVKTILFFSPSESVVLREPALGELGSAVWGTELAVLLHHQARPDRWAAEHAGTQTAGWVWYMGYDGQMETLPAHAHVIRTKSLSVLILQVQKHPKTLRLRFPGINSVRYDQSWGVTGSM